MKRFVERALSGILHSSESRNAPRPADQKLNKDALIFVGWRRRGAASRLKAAPSFSFKLNSGVRWDPL